MLDIVKLQEYATTLRHRYFEALAKLPWEELVRNREASLNSLRNIFLHMLNAEENYVNYIVAKKGGTYAVYDFDKYNDIEAVKRQMNAVEAKTKACLASLKEQALLEVYEWTGYGGKPMKGSGEDILTHLVLEEVHHFGELIGLLWQMNIEPPHLGWLQYLEAKP